MAATGYLLTALVIWAVLTALGAAGDEHSSAPQPRLKRAGARARARGARVSVHRARAARNSAPALVEAAPFPAVSLGLLARVDRAE